MIRPTPRLVSLASLSAIGIIGMLIAEGALDWLFLALAVLLLLLGAAAMIAVVVIRRP